MAYQRGLGVATELCRLSLHTHRTSDLRERLGEGGGRRGVGRTDDAGALPKPSLDDLIKQVRELDMDMVRAEIAQREAEGEESAE